MNEHLTSDIAEQYVIGALDAESVRFVEGHVAQCAECARSLQREAALEVGLHLLGLESKKVISLSARRRRRVGAMLASAAAAMAAGAVLVFSAAPQASVSSQPAVRRCDDAKTSSACISQAQFDGVITIGPNREPIVPRYDVITGGTP